MTNEADFVRPLEMSAERSEARQTNGASEAEPRFHVSSFQTGASPAPPPDPPGLPPSIVVAAAVVRRGDAVLVTRRLAGTHLAGLWEFPGGKCEPGETHEACLAREMREELDVAVRIGARLLSTRHDYGSKIVELHFFDCQVDDEPRPLLGQETRWIACAELSTLEFPAADAELIALLSPPPRSR